LFSDIFPLIPSLINHLNPDNDTSFIGASDVLQELLDQSTGKPNSHNLLTDPLLIWVDSVGRRIIQSTTEAGMVDEVSHSMCKLLTSLGDHGSDYFSHHFVSNEPCGPSTKGALIQMFLQALLSYTGLAGYYGVDEEESEMVLGFWYLFQESLWSEDISGKDDSPEEQQQKLAQRAALSKVLYVELVKVLRRKVTYPPHGHGWAKGGSHVLCFRCIVLNSCCKTRWKNSKCEHALLVRRTGTSAHFAINRYRRDVGDTLINA